MKKVFILIGGYILSISIGYLLISKGQATLNSIAIGLLVSVFTTLVGILVDMNKNQDEIIKALVMNKQFNKDENLRSDLCNFMDDYMAISTSNPQEKLFVEVSKTTVNKCFQTVAKLAKGKLVVENDDRRLNYMFSKIEGDTKESVKAITWLAKGKINWWTRDNPTGKRYFEVQKKAVERNVGVTRIIIVSNQRKADLQRLISDQIAVGIEVWTVREKSVSRELLVNSLICDDKWVTKSYFDVNGKRIGGLISINKADISEAMQQWNSLIHQAKNITDVDKDID